MKSKIEESGQSTCMYCGSTAYGPGCPFGPKNMHVHPHNAGRCIYCGSQATGPGCPHNPVSDIHVHGVDFNMMIKECLQNGLTMGYLMKRLSQPIKEWNAYRVGIINESGVVIRKPNTLKEKSMLTPADRYVLRLKTLIDKNKLELLNNSIYLTNSSISADIMQSELYTESYKNELVFKDKINEQIKSLFTAISKANLNGISTTKIESIIVESISDL